MICRKVTFSLPDATCPAARVQKCRFCAREARKRGFQTPKAHKNLDFVLEKPENEGFKAPKSTKTPILCSKSPKMRVSNPKSAQKPRFCARNARKRGFQTPKSTKTPILCSGRLTGGLRSSSRLTQRASGSGEAAAGQRKEHREAEK